MADLSERKKCCLCQELIEGKCFQDGWGNWAHNHHQTSTCTSCQRIISPSSSKGGAIYTDGRSICNLCKPFTISDPIKTQQSKNRVLKLLIDKGFLDIPLAVPVKLTSSTEFNRKLKTHPDSIKGLTISTTQFKGKVKASISHSIYIVIGLHQIEFEAVLVHELLHVWLNEHTIALPYHQTEGFCNLGSALVYEASDSQLASFLLKNMEKDPDPIYGQGFRRLRTEVRRYGWNKLISELLTNKTLPTTSLWAKIFS
jgi:hypothetical protein